MSTPPVLASVVARITFFEDRAEVERSAVIDLSAGVQTVSLGGLSLFVDDESLIASIEVEGEGSSDVRVLTAKMTRRSRSEAALPSAQLAALEAERDEKVTRRTQLDQSLQRTLASKSRLEGMLGQWIEAVQHTPRGDSSNEALREAFGKISSALVESAAERASKESSRVELDEQLAAANARFDLGSRKVTRHEGVAEAQVSSSSPCKARIKIVYRVACALWRPEHWVQLVDDNNQPWGKKLIIRTIATAWQRPGEDWSEVPCRFSTARPSQSASAPLLTDDVLYLTRRADPGTIHVQAREQTIQRTAGESGQRAVESMPGVDDGGEPLWLEAKSHASIASDGRPVRIDVDRVELACSVDRVAFPEKSTSVHLRAKGTLTRSTPLLAGPTR
ncbi:MAG: mucoidy inhibitor MuiA family protein [Polyangiaceae bacterium]